MVMSSVTPGSAPDGPSRRAPTRSIQRPRRSVVTKPIIPRTFRWYQQVGRSGSSSSHTHAVPAAQACEDGHRPDPRWPGDGSVGVHPSDVVSIEIDSITIELYLWRPGNHLGLVIQRWGPGIERCSARGADDPQAAEVNLSVVVPADENQIRQVGRTSIAQERM